jgi:hypothetical protein
VRRRRHSIDLLPLLDVFMVVLFVFATIQEQRLDDTTRDAERLEQRIAEADRALAAATAREATRAREQETRAAEHALDAAALTEARDEAQHLRRELESLRQGVLDHQAETSAALARVGLPEQTLERLSLLSRLLEKHNVLEIELVGQPGEGGAPIENRCCYRVDPLRDQWRSCGRVSTLAEQRERWLDAGAHGLAEALRATKGGNAMTLVRQDLAASYRIASHLAELLRTRFSDQYVDVEEAPVLTVRCVD